MIGATGLIIFKDNKFYIDMRGVVFGGGKNKCFLDKKDKKNINEKILKSKMVSLEYPRRGKNYDKLGLYHNEELIEFNYKEVYEFTLRGIITTIIIPSPSNPFIADRYQLVDGDFNVISENKKDIIKFICSQNQD